MTTDKRVLDALFAGDNAAFALFYKQCRDLFFGYFGKHFPEAQPVVKDLYQDSILDLWNQINDGRTTKESIKGDLSTFLISIGKNKWFTEVRRSIKDAKYKKDEPMRKTYTRKEDIPDDKDAQQSHPLQSVKQQKELEKHINVDAYERFRPKIIEIEADLDADLARSVERQQHVFQAIDNMQEPCRQLILYSWHERMTDEDILEAFGGRFPTTNAIKTQRYRCHQKLRETLREWYEDNK